MARARKKRTYIDRIRSAARKNARDALEYSGLYPNNPGTKGVHLRAREVNEIAKILDAPRIEKSDENVALTQIANFVNAGVVPTVAHPDAQPLLEKIAHIKAKRDELAQKKIESDDVISRIDEALTDSGVPTLGLPKPPRMLHLLLRIRTFKDRKEDAKSAEILRLKRIVASQTQEIYRLSGFPHSAKNTVETAAPLASLGVAILMASGSRSVEAATETFKIIMQQVEAAFPPLRFFKLGDSTPPETLAIAGKNAA